MTRAQFCRQRRVLLGGRGRRDLGFNQAHCCVDEQAILDPSAGRGLGIECEAGRLHRRAIGNRGMAIDPAEPHRPVTDHGVDVGRGREALVGP